MDPSKISNDSDTMSTWRSLIAATFVNGDDSFDNIEAVNLHAGRAPDRQWLDVEFANGWGSPPAPSFTMWTHRFIYFPVSYDGLHSAGRISRQPDRSKPRHYGLC